MTDPDHFFRGLVSFIDNLLDRQPFSQSHLNHGQDSADRGQSSNGRAAGPHCTARPLSDAHETRTAVRSAKSKRSGVQKGSRGQQAVKEPASQHINVTFEQSLAAVQSWPTPSAAAWEEIQLVSRRLWLTLEWLLTPDWQTGPYPGPKIQGSSPLMCELAALLYKLLAGHILDPNLDMQKTFTSGLLPVMMAWSKHGVKIQPVNDLGWLLMKRIVADDTLRSLSNTTDESAARALQNPSPSPSELIVLREFLCVRACSSLFTYQVSGKYSSCAWQLYAVCFKPKSQTFANETLRERLWTALAITVQQTDWAGSFPCNLFCTDVTASSNHLCVAPLREAQTSCKSMHSSIGCSDPVLCTVDSELFRTSPVLLDVFLQI